MEFVFEILFQFVGEILLQVSFEFLAELGLHSLGDTFKKPRNPALSTIGFILWGALAHVYIVTLVVVASATI